MFNETDKSYSIINTKTMNKKSLILNLETAQPINSCIINEHNLFSAISLIPNLPMVKDKKNEFSLVN